MILPREIQRQIIKRLEDGNNRNDIILDLCESQGLDWKQAEAILDSIHAENAEGIRLTQSPILVLVALAIFIGGVGVVIYSAVQLAAMYNLFDSMSAQNQARGIGAFLTYLIIDGAGYLGLVLLGTGMIAGSLRGMSEVWSAIFAKLGWFRGVE
ncbi:MAG: hypothetical protein HFACDABA_01053 [Anaerolineales bacterium]|nr:hypothetical protein [Anaerolineales bacterium]